MNRPGKKLTTSLQRELRVLPNLEWAARRVGADPKMIRTWYERGKRDQEADRDSHNARFALALDHARCQCALRQLNMIERLSCGQMTGDWREPARFLEQHFADELETEAREPNPLDAYLAAEARRFQPPTRLPRQRPEPYI